MTAILQMKNFIFYCISHSLPSQTICLKSLEFFAFKNGGEHGQTFVHDSVAITETFSLEYSHLDGRCDLHGIKAFL